MPLPTPLAQALRDEIRDDPLDIGYAAMSDSQRADSLNEERYSIERPVPLADLQLHLQDTGVWDLLLEASYGTDIPVRAAAQAILDIANAKYSAYDVRRIAFQNRLTTLVTAEVLTQEQADAITALKNTSASRAEILCGVGSVASYLDL